MGKQLNYYMDYDSFLIVAQTALDNGCIIVRENFWNPNSDKKIVQARDLSIIIKEWKSYYFYLPEAGDLVVKYMPGEGSERLERFGISGSASIIEAGYSFIRDKRILRSRIYSYSGYYDENGEWIPRDERILKLYNKLVRVVKKIAPYTELTDIRTNMDDEQCEYKHKEYITPYCLQLRERDGYKLG